MGEYEVFGGFLRSEMMLPELKATSRERVDWTFRIVNDRPPLLASQLLGEERLIESVSVRLESHVQGFRLTFDDTGAFDVSADGSSITWYPNSGAGADLARVDLLGRVMSLAMHARGDLSLHASAVEINGRAIAFVGAKGRGKSTLALSLVGQGARLLSDDTVGVLLSQQPHVVPGVRSARLWDDSAAVLGRRGQAYVEPDGGKLVVDKLPDAELAQEPVPLDAVYVIAPLDFALTPVRRFTLLPKLATIALVPHSKLAPLLGRGQAGSVLDRTASLVSLVPVYALEISRDLASLHTVTQTILDWHAPREKADGASA